MSRVRVGTDLVETATVADALAAFGRAYLERLFTPDEIAYCQAGGSQLAQRLAARFAAKEACLKVLRPPDGGIDWRCIEVRKMPGGWCDLHLHGAAEGLARAQGLTDWSVSLSHEGLYAIAVVAATSAS
ncbi:4'-phosphopantetheinyl transferase superfamily protein [Xylophilus sp. Kf1]|nr:4'-phosphopantetheinyl transferase superfamily protein [Xylophilus sp. Kf1]